MNNTEAWWATLCTVKILPISYSRPSVSQFSLSVVPLMQHFLHMHSCFVSVVLHLRIQPTVDQKKWVEKNPHVNGSISGSWVCWAVSSLRDPGWCELCALCFCHLNTQVSPDGQESSWRTQPDFWVESSVTCPWSDIAHEGKNLEDNGSQIFVNQLLLTFELWGRVPKILLHRCSSKSCL